MGYADQIISQMSNIGKPRVTTTEIKTPNESFDISSLGEIIGLLLMLDQMNPRTSTSIGETPAAGANPSAAAANALMGGAPGTGAMQERPYNLAQILSQLKGFMPKLGGLGGI